MYERFTDRARKVLQLANQEALRFNHEYIGTEHILLGLVKEGSGVGANVLKNLDIDLRKIRLEVEKIVQSGPDMVTMGKLPQTPRAKKVIEFAIEESRNFNHNYVGTEHMLLGLIREVKGIASQVLMNLGLKLEDIREAVLSILGQNLDKQDKMKGWDMWIERFNLEKERAVVEHDFDRAAKFRDWADEYKKHKELLINELGANYKSVKSSKLKELINSLSLPCITQLEVVIIKKTTWDEIVRLINE